MWYRNLLKVTQLARIDYELKPKTIQNEICFLNNAFLMMFWPLGRKNMERAICYITQGTSSFLLMLCYIIIAVFLTLFLKVRIKHWICGKLLWSSLSHFLLHWVHFFHLHYLLPLFDIWTLALEYTFNISPWKREKVYIHTKFGQVSL